MSDPHSLPGAVPPDTVPYVLRQGDGLSHLVAGQVVRTLAGVAQTAGGFGVVECDCPLDRGPIPMHWHEREHDTWFITRGRLQVWAGDQSRVLAPGDFAYVRPGDTHSYQSVAPRTRFFGVVAPGGWEQFFADAGEVWGITALPPADRPFDFSRMGPAMGKHRIMRVADPVFAAATPVGEADQHLPGRHASFFLEAGFGPRRAVAGHLVTTVLGAAESDGLVELRVIEGGRDAATPALSHARTHLFLYVIDGVVELTLDGATHRLAGGDAANLPAGTRYATRVASGSARWLATSANGDGGAWWDRVGAAADGFSHPTAADPVDPATVVAGGLDVVLG